MRAWWLRHEEAIGIVLAATFILAIFAFGYYMGHRPS